MFDTTKTDLRDLLRDVEEGRLQLPEFQRDYVWNDEDVQSLIASVAKGYPIGALLTLEHGGDLKLKPRLLEGVPARSVEPKELLLDGQQRMTSLYQTLMAKAPVRTRTAYKVEVERFYYIDITAAVVAGADIKGAILGVPGDRIIRENFGKDIKLDLSRKEFQFEKNLFPLNLVFDAKNWLYDWRDYWRARGQDMGELERQFDRAVLDRIQRYKMPIIRLDRTNSREAICTVFEKVNVGGKKLDAFELVTAIYAGADFDLRLDWMGDGTPANPGRRARAIGSPNRRDVLTELASTDFLQCCTLLETRRVRLARQAAGASGKELPPVSCNRDALLALELGAYRMHADAVEQGFVRAAGFLNELKIVWHKDVPYPSQIVAAAAVSAVLGHKAETAAAKEKLATWFWCISLGELYGSSTETRLARDVPQLVDWIEGGGGPPASISDALFQRDRLGKLRSRGSAAYKAINALLMKHGCRDFISGKPTDIMTFFNEKIDIHHVFPQAWCISRKIDPGRFNAIINKTPLSRRTNIVIGGSAPSRYLKRIEQDQGISSDKLDEIIASHLIDPAHLRNDDFEAFYYARQSVLADLVAKAMDKPVVMAAGANEPEREADDPADRDENEPTEQEAA